MATPRLLSYFKTFTTNQHGNIRLGGIHDIKAYTKVHIEIMSWPNPTSNLKATVMMGKIKGTTLAQTVGTFSITSSPKIHSYEVVGPDLVVSIKGPKKKKVNIQAWVFLH